MMDRRRLIVGGSAAAVATTLGAVAGPSLAARAASIWGTGPTSTLEHAQRVLDQVNIDLGLVNPDGLRRQYERSYADALASSPRDPKEYHLEAWVDNRLWELCRTDSYAAALTEIPQSRSLLAFSFLVYSQNQDMTLPRLDLGMRVPAVLDTLETDFFPVLSDLITQKSNESREFAYVLQTTAAELDRMVAEKLKESLGEKGSVQAMPGNPSGKDALEFTVGVLVFLSFLYWIKRGGK
jgi:hypothetical protein